jgi:hypothetical protein
MSQATQVDAPTPASLPVEVARSLYAAPVPVVNGEGVTLTVLVPISRINPERQAAILADARALGGDLSDHVSWLPSFSARRA